MSTPPLPVPSPDEKGGWLETVASLRKIQPPATHGIDVIENYTGSVAARVTKGCAGCWEKAPRNRHHQWELKVGNWNISSLRGKEQELVDETMKYQLDIVGLSSTKRPGSGLLNLNGRKLFYSDVDITTRAQAGIGVLVEPNLADRKID
ncbi:unnamed protein product [Soboliphyme baturini]|uniref:PH domain-containing protein n=1 Tax=Soboliphyme baturini TaxID=241478 RepID=A0A183IWG6_9BILA|nr:unnamed protein product [Soboliphyme baturini]